MKCRERYRKGLLVMLLAFVAAVPFAVIGSAEEMTQEAAETETSPAETETFAEEETSPLETETVAEADTSLSDMGDLSSSDDSGEEDLYEDEAESLSMTQRNSVNMLNYMSVLTQEINESKGNQIFLESAYSSLVNDIYPNAVDTKTQAQITSLMDTIDSYRMIARKKDRLEYIYEQNSAQAFRRAIPNPLGILSMVQSRDLLKAAASVIYMAADSVTSYQESASQADLQFLEDGWELEDEELEELHSSTKDALSYMLNMVRDYDLPGDYALNQESVESFAEWSEKPDSQIVNKIAWLESHQDTYQEFGPYWLELAADYYNNGEYEECLEAIHTYEAVSTRIFRKDADYAQALPMVIISAKETMEESEYLTTAQKYCSLIMENTKDADWKLRYFVAQIYLDLYTATQDSTYLDEALQIAFDNVVVLVDEQKELNASYLADVETVKTEKGATKREKSEAKEYNKSIKSERKIALPPVSEALYLNCDLLFALIEEADVSSEDKSRIDSILHENGGNLFLTQALDDRFWFEERDSGINAEEIEVSFDGKELTIPAVYVTDRSVISAEVSGTALDDWTVKSVKRPKNSESASEFIVSYKSDAAKDYDFQAGETITFKVIPVAESPDEYVEFQFNAVEVKKAVVFDGLSFERIVE